MNDSTSQHNRWIALFVSLAVNIFLIAFMLGRFSSPGLMPPPPFDLGGMPMPPPIMAGGPHSSMPMDKGGHRMPHPPFFGPGDLFTPDEMQANGEPLRENFEKLNALREAFAKKLTDGAVSKEDVLKHFADMDQIFDQVRKQTQQKAAEKISNMSPEERQRFAKTLGKPVAQDPIPTPPPAASP